MIMQMFNFVICFFVEAGIGAGHITQPRKASKELNSNFLDREGKNVATMLPNQIRLFRPYNPSI